MSSVITLEITEDVARRAEEIAVRTNRRVEDVLSSWLTYAVADLPIEWLSDDEILALSDLDMPDDQQDELSELLNLSREGILGDKDHERLSLLVHTYRRGLVRKAQAIHAAVERGLRSPLE